MLNSKIILLGLVGLSLILRAQAQQVTILCYHDVVESRNDVTPDAVYLDQLIDHFEWFRANDINIVSLDEVIKSKDSPLPKNAVMLTFDDGYISFYDKVYPLLKVYNYPAMLAIVSEWMKGEAQDSVQYGDRKLSRSRFVSWDQIKEMDASGLVEIASHSSNGHQGILSNSQGNELPFFTATAYDSLLGYETEVAFQSRVRDDLQASKLDIEEQSDIVTRAIVWPFGRYNDVTIDIANELGMRFTLALNYLPDEMRHDGVFNRFYINNNTTINDIRRCIDFKSAPGINRFARVNIENVAMAKDSLEIGFSEFISKTFDAKPNLLFINPLIRMESGESGVYFNNTSLPILANKQSRTIWQLQTRLDLDVHLVLSNDLLSKNWPDQFYSDMGRYSPVRGILLEDVKLFDQLISIDEQDSMLSPSVELLNSQTRRDNRKDLLKKQKIKSLRAIESFQKYQPILNIGFQVNAEQLNNNSVQAISTYFDYCFVDLGQEDLKSALEILRSMDLKDSNKKYVFIQFDTSASYKKIKSFTDQLEALGYISFGTDGQVLNEPTKRIILSSRTFPYRL